MYLAINHENIQKKDVYSLCEQNDLGSYFAFLGFVSLSRESYWPEILSFIIMIPPSLAFHSLMSIYLPKLLALRVPSSVWRAGLFSPWASSGRKAHISQLASAVQWAQAVYPRIQEQQKNVKWMDCYSQEKEQAPCFHLFFISDNNWLFLLASPGTEWGALWSTPHRRLDAGQGIFWHSLSFIFAYCWQANMRDSRKQLTKTLSVRRKGQEVFKALQI